MSDWPCMPLCCRHRPLPAQVLHWLSAYWATLSAAWRGLAVARDLLPLAAAAASGSRTALPDKWASITGSVEGLVERPTPKVSSKQGRQQEKAVQGFFLPPCSMVPHILIAVGRSRRGRGPAWCRQRRLGLSGGCSASQPAS